MVKITDEYLKYMRSNLKTFNRWNSEQVEKLLNHIDAIEAEKDKLIDNVGQLQKELQQEREGKKVALPKEVAEALDSLRSESDRQSDDDYMLWNLLQGPKEEDAGELDHFIQTLVNENKLSAFDLAKALMYGYTIEEPPSVESRIQSTIEAELNRQGIRSPIPINELAVQLTNLISPIVVKDAMQHD